MTLEERETKKKQSESKRNRTKKSVIKNMTEEEKQATWETFVDGVNSFTDDFLAEEREQNTLNINNDDLNKSKYWRKFYTRPYQDLQNDYHGILQELKKRRQIFITNNGRIDAVLIDVADYAEYENFLHTRYVNEKLDEAEREAADPNAKWYSHEEFWEKVKGE